MTDLALGRLAGSVVIEPLVNRWPAWSQIIAPVPAGFQALRYQMPLLESFVANPELHARAARDPELAGGAFADLTPADVPAARDLLRRTGERLAPNMAFAKDLLQFQGSLVSTARGESLEPFYERLPATLRGFVELVYDYEHRPAVRPIESLLYRSRYYQPGLQSLRLFHLTRDDARPYFMNTPRLEGGDGVEIAIAFDDSRVGQIAELDRTHAPVGAIAEILDTTPERIRPLLTPTPPTPGAPWTGDGIRLRHFGHACVLIEAGGVSVLTDPYVPVRPREGGARRFSFDDLPPAIDFAVVTHNHHDHFAIESLLRLRGRIQCLIVPKSFGLLAGDPSLRSLARALGIREIREVDEFETIAMPNGESLTSIPFLGEHSDILQAKVAYVVRAGNRQMLFAADSDCLDREMYANVRQALGPVDTVFLGMECVGAPLSFGYGPLLPRKAQREHDQSRRQRGCDDRRGIELLRAIGAGRVYNYAMGLEPWMQHILGLTVDASTPQWQASDRLVDACQRAGFVDARRLMGGDELVLSTEAECVSPTFAVSQPPAAAPEVEDEFAF